MGTSVSPWVQAWPPIMTGALRTSVVLAAAANYYSCEVKCLPSKVGRCKLTLSNRR